MSESPEPLVAALICGVRHSIQQMKYVTVPSTLTPDDFNTYFTTHIKSNMFERSQIPNNFKFKEYCPLVFQNLRRRFHIQDECYQNSLLEHSLINLDSPGRSGARFFLSHDKQFILKTIDGDEYVELCRILSDYHQYVVERDADTLLPQFLSMYRVTLTDSETHLVVMRCVFSPHFSINCKYDLKGSTVEREASEKELAKVSPTLKDVDFINSGTAFHVCQSEQIKLMSILKSDTQFLSRLKLMDYSLLVGVHRCCDAPQAAGETSLNLCDASAGVFAIKSTSESPQPEIYFLAIIDILTRYGVKKRTANAAKTVKYGAGVEISTVEPELYARRFLSFIENIFKIETQRH